MTTITKITGAIVFALVSPWTWRTNIIEIETLELVLVAVSIIIIAVAHFGAIICHEIYEINDQLAGRSPDLKEWMTNNRAGND